MSSAPKALARLVEDPDEFVRTRFGRAPLHAIRADPGGFADLLSLDDVDDLVASTGLRAPGFRLVRDGRTLPRSAVTRTARIGSRPVDDLVDVAAVQREFAAGATVVLQGLHRSWAPVTTFCRSLEVELTHAVQANAYLTPPVAQGLHLHADPHDVFALQTHGVKRWVVHPEDRDEPWDIELRPGDVLYLPAGTRHAAQTIEQPSLHLTIGIRVLTWRDLVRRAAEDALADPALDVPLPAGWAEAPGSLREELERHVSELAGRLGTGADLQPVIERRANGFWRTRTPDLSGGLRDILEVGDLHDASQLRYRRGTGAHLIDDGRCLLLVLADRELRMPIALRAVIERIVALGSFAPKELDALIDEPSRLVLCRWLVRHGVLTLDRQARARW